MSRRIVGNHHITLSTGGAQEDWDFHTQALGLRPVKKTMLYDGAEPVYHLYYANADIDAGSILTSFPMRQQGKLGRRGSNQVKEIGLSIDDGSIDYWANRLDELGFATEHTEALGTKRLRFAHPCGIPYTLVGTSGDSRRGYGEGGVPSEHGIKGAYAPVISVIDPDEMVMYLETGLEANEGRRGRPAPGVRGGRRVRRPSGARPRARTAAGDVALRRGHAAPLGVGRRRRGQPDGAQGLHRGARLHRRTEQKDRGYFLSCYNRTPGGALFEYAFTPADRGFLIDETEDQLGTTVQIPPPFAHLAQEMLDYLEPIEDRR